MVEESHGNAAVAEAFFEPTVFGGGDPKNSPFGADAEEPTGDDHTPHSWGGETRSFAVIEPMPFAPFFELFPEVAPRETRSITISRMGDLPRGTYRFIELFCNEDGCDCRRVFIHAFGQDTPPSGALGPLLATISFGWEERSFYRKWASFPLSTEDLNELKGPALVRMTPQSEYAPALLRHFKTFVQDDAYVARIVRHYQMYRNTIDGGKPKPPLTPVHPEPKPGRNQPCPCGSGKKYKKCCLGKAEPLPSVDPKPNPKTQKQLVLTTTGELFQRVRLYCELSDRLDIDSRFSKLACMDFDEDEGRWVWLYIKEAKKLRFKYAYSSIPKHLHPIVIGSFYFRKEGEMLLDVRSIERAYEAVPFFDHYLDRGTARITHAAILNELPVLDGPPDARVSELDCDDLFSDSNIGYVDSHALAQKMMGLKEVDSQDKKLEMLGAILEQESNKSLPRVEKFPVHYHGEGIEQLKGTLTLRQIVAMEHWHGNKEYTVLDAIKKVARSASEP
jgi:hypothetical protein